MQTHLILIGLLFISCLAEPRDDECERFSPLELKEVVFDKLLYPRLQAVLDMMDGIQDGLNDMMETIPKIKEQLKKEDGEEVIPVAAVQQEVGIIMSVHARQWNQIWDTQQDLLQPERTRAPKTLTDLRDTIDELPEAYRSNAASLEEVLESSLENTIDLFRPLVLVLEQMVKLGGEATKAATMEKMVKGVLGKILLQLLQIKQDGKQVDRPPMFEDLISLSQGLKEDFAASGRRVGLDEFWRTNLQRMIAAGHHNQEPVGEDYQIKLIAYMMNKKMRLETVPPLDMAEALKNVLPK